MENQVTLRRSAAIACVASLVTSASLAGCVGGGGDAPSPPNSPRSGDAPLSEYKSIALKGPGASAAAAAVAQERGKVIASAQSGDVRLFFYVHGKRCGVYVTSIGSKEPDANQLGAHAPDESDDTLVPGGPYQVASGSGLANPSTWASLSCGRSSMYVEFDSEQRIAPKAPMGPVSAAKSKKNQARSVFAVGRQTTRQAVLMKVAGA